MPARTRHAAMANHEALLDALKALTAERDEERRLRLAAESRLNASSAVSARKLDQERRLRLAAESRLNASLAASARALDQERRLRLVAESRLSASLAASRTLDEERRLRLAAESRLSASSAASARMLDQERRLRLAASSRLSASSAERDKERRLRLMTEEVLDAESRLRLMTEVMLKVAEDGLSASSAELDRRRLVTEEALKIADGLREAGIVQAAQSESVVQALQDKLAALLAAGLDAQAVHSKAISDQDAEIASFRARVLELEGRVDELVKEKEHIATTHDLKAGGPEASGDSDKSKSEINDENDESQQTAAAVSVHGGA